MNFFASSYDGGATRQNMSNSMHLPVNPLTDVQTDGDGQIVMAKTRTWGSAAGTVKTRK